MRIWVAVLAGLQILSAGSGLTDLIPGKWAALFALIIASAQGGTAYYMKPDQAQRPEIKSEAPIWPRPHQD